MTFYYLFIGRQTELFTLIFGFQLERLKKFVNDEAPVIPIGDAITCFQRKKSKPKKKYAEIYNSMQAKSASFN